MGKPKVKVGVVGMGKMGALHLRKYQENPDCEVVGVFETNPERIRALSEITNIRIFENLAELFFEIDAVTISSPTTTHYAIARLAFDSGVHVLIEKPMTPHVREAEELVSIAKAKGLVLQVGFVERYRYRALCEGLTSSPVKFIDSVRFLSSIGRESDIDVVTDLMIHDIDLVLSVISEEPNFISATGVAVLNSKFDVVNARLEFPGGAVANLNASRVSLKPSRRFQVFSLENFTSFDLMNNQADVYFRTETGSMDCLTIRKQNIDALAEQCRQFVGSVRGDHACPLPGTDGLRSLRVAQQILEKIDQRFAPAPPKAENSEIRQ